MSVMKEDFIAQYMSDSCPCEPNHPSTCDGETVRRDAREAWERRLLNLQRFERDALLAKETFDEGNQAEVPRKDPESDKQTSVVKEDFIAEYMSDTCPCQPTDPCACDVETLRRDAQEAWERRLLNLQCFECDALLAKEIRTTAVAGSTSNALNLDIRRRQPGKGAAEGSGERQTGVDRRER